MFVEIHKLTGLINLNKIDKIEKNTTKGFIQNPDGSKEECYNYNIDFIRKFDNGDIQVHSKHFDTKSERDAYYEKLYEKLKEL